MKRIFWTIALIFGATVAQAQEDTMEWRFGGDAFKAGRDIAISDEAADVFAAGQHVKLSGDASGTAHLAGQNVTVTGQVGENLYAVGQNISVSGTIRGNATMVAQDVTVTSSVSGNLRAAAGSKVTLQAPVEGSAAIGARNVYIGDAIAGDLALSAEAVEWGEGVSVTGRVLIFGSDPTAIDVPETVAPASRVDRIKNSNWDIQSHDFDASEHQGRSWFQRFSTWLRGIIIVGLLGAAFAIFAPNFSNGLRNRTLAWPMRAVWFGFLALSTALGSILLLALTGIGLILAPFVLIAAVLLGFAGYVVGCYLIGVWSVERFWSRDWPEDMGGKIAAALFGTFVVAILSLIPFLGWIVALLVAFGGAGAFAIRFWSPGFFVDPLTRD